MNVREQLAHATFMSYDIYIHRSVYIPGASLKKGNPKQVEILELSLWLACRPKGKKANLLEI